MSDRFFASDNAAPVHPEVMEAIARANAGHAIAYGEDKWTIEAISALNRVFGRRSGIHFVYNGTGANVVGLQTALAGYNAVVCTQSSHLHLDECGAPERITGSKLITVPEVHGRMDPEAILRELHVVGVEHHSQPKVVSITNSTELGTVYSPDLVREIASVCHRNDMYLHMDGARISNAAVALGLELAEATGKLGVDMLSLGGTKNGLMFGEAVVLFDRKLEQGLRYIRKQAMQLASKMRYIAVQFRALFAGDLWQRLAHQANDMAIALSAGLQEIPGVEVVHPVEANAVFARLPAKAIPRVQKELFFYVWDQADSVIRLMCSYDTSESDVARLIDAVKGALG